MYARTKEDNLRQLKRLAIRIPLPVMTLYWLIGTEPTNPKLAAFAITVQIMIDIFQPSQNFEAQTKKLLSSEPRKYLNTPERVQRAVLAAEVLLLAICTLY